ncbi:hypothetical protein [Pedobacter sp. FW305-3-2-15-E-R2A2]|uniref:hypothetical protein n=1 Tax=Pedobacter sp. FW305-3-2-15-E-R2A2 TaxID=3140251 RepID=UPI0031402BD4
MANWYVRITGADPTLPASYTLVGINPPSCPGTGKICSIKADDDGTGLPIITPALQSEIAAALSTNVDQPNALLRSAT